MTLRVAPFLACVLLCVPAAGVRPDHERDAEPADVARPSDDAARHQRRHGPASDLPHEGDACRGQRPRRRRRRPASPRPEGRRVRDLRRRTQAGHPVVCRVHLSRGLDPARHRRVAQRPERRHRAGDQRVEFLVARDRDPDRRPAHRRAAYPKARDAARHLIASLAPSDLLYVGLTSTPGVATGAHPRPPPRPRDRRVIRRSSTPRSHPRDAPDAADLLQSPAPGDAHAGAARRPPSSSGRCASRTPTGPSADRERGARGRRPTEVPRLPDRRVVCRRLDYHRLAPSVPTPPARCSMRWPRRRWPTSLSTR